MSADDGTDAATEGSDAGAVLGADHGAGPLARPIGPLVALGLAVALFVAAIAVAIVGGDDVSATAVRVNSSEVSQKTFNAQLRELSPLLRAQGAPASEATDAFVPSDTAARLAQVYVTNALLRDHVKITAADRQAVISQSGSALSQYSPDLRAELVDLTAMTNALSSALGQAGAQQFLRHLGRHADVHVDPRYGYWNAARAQVCAPTGCTSTGTSAGG